MKFAMDMPASPRGTTEQQLQKLYRYMYRMTEQLNLALNNLDAGNFIDETGEAITGAASTKEVSRELTAQYDSLKSLIIKTADTVRSEMDEVAMELRGSYLALSEWGEFQEALTGQITATASGVVQQYGYDAQLEAAAEGIADFQTYKTQTGQYIKTGLLYYDGAVPRYGVAVGEQLTTVIVDDEEVLTRTDLCATFTADKLSFWQSGVEVAYISNTTLYITDLRILNRIRLGDWEIRHDNGFEITWIGA